jgi:uncharacterized protein with HEPN domain
MSDDRLYLIHIHEAIGRIKEYVQDGREAFLESRLIQDAVIRNLQTLAESTQRLSGAFKQRLIRTSIGGPSPASATCWSTTTWAWT